MPLLYFYANLAVQVHFSGVLQDDVGRREVQEAEQELAN